MHKELAYTLLFIWFLTDIGILWNYCIAPLAHLEFLTSWSHLISVSSRIGLVVHLYYDERSYKYAVFFFYASGVLLASILVTFFVVILIDDELFTERVNYSLLPHYTFNLRNGGCNTSNTDFQIGNYLEERGIDQFASIGVMIVYNNLRHVFPAVAHMLVVTLIPTLRCTLVVYASSWKGPFSLATVLAITAGTIPLLHFLVNSTVGEERLYRVDPCLPAFAMVISIIGAANVYVAIDTWVPNHAEGNQSEKADTSKHALQPASELHSQNPAFEPPPYVKLTSSNRRFIL
jgi:hypothetical protein